MSTAQRCKEYNLLQFEKLLMTYYVLTLQKVLQELLFSGS